MVEYPTNLPLECVQRAIAIISSKTIQENQKEFEQCIWNVVGYLLFLKSAGTSIFGDVNPAHSGELQNALEDLHDAISNSSMDETYGAADPEEAGSILTVITVMSTALQLLQYLRMWRTRSRVVDTTPPEPIDTKVLNVPTGDN